MIHYNEKQRWLYLSNQMSSELLVFRQVDSVDKAKFGVPHTSFANPGAAKDCPGRESIEVRAMVCFNE